MQPWDNASQNQGMSWEEQVKGSKVPNNYPAQTAVTVQPRLLREGRFRAVGAYIGSAYFFTSSTSFADPAIPVGGKFSTRSPASLRRLRRASSVRKPSAGVAGTAVEELRPIVQGIDSRVQALLADSIGS